MNLDIKSVDEYINNFPAAVQKNLPLSDKLSS